jgi:putative ABC transport system permease protein
MKVSRKEGTGSSPLASVLRVAVSDQLHEPLLTACLVTAIAAVLVPLLLLYSVKIGFVERIRSDLIRDPTFREIQPAEADVKSPDILERYSKLPGVAFFAPSVMLTPREISIVSIDGGRKSLQARLLPTGKGDPVLERIEGGWDMAVADAIVVSRDIAEAMKLTPGSEADLVVARTENRKTARVTVRAKVTGVLANGAAGVPTILAAHSLDQAVEAYRAGIAVPDRSWPAVTGAPKQAYEAVLIGAPRALDEVERRDIQLSVGGLNIDEVASPSTGMDPIYGLFALTASAKSEPAFALRPGLTWFYLLTNTDKDATAYRYYSAEDVAEAHEIAARFAGHAFGVNRPWHVEAAAGKWELSLPDPRLFIGMRSTSYPWRFGNADLEPNLTLYVSSGEFSGTEAMKLTFVPPQKDAGVSLEIEATLVPQSFITAGQALASPALIAMLNRGFVVPVAYDATNRTIVDKVVGLRGFRLVARELEDVPRLVAAFGKMDVPVRAKSEAIEKLQRLDRSLGYLVLALGLITFLGGITVMSATCISNVKRKSVQYATLRLIGLPRSRLFLVPVIQAATAAAAAVVLSLIFFMAFSAIINGYVAKQVDFDGKLSVLGWHHLAAAAVVVILGAVASSLLAARQATSIDPSLALRAEA